MDYFNILAIGFLTATFLFLLRPCEVKETISVKPITGKSINFVKYSNGSVKII